MGARPIYVEIRIRGAMDELWRRTQTPELHERWDLRFSSIRELPHDLHAGHDRAGGGAHPRRFRYATRIGFGLEIAGWGETLRSVDAPGRRSSTLRFGSHDPRSLIRSGAGYWRYEDTGDGLRFVTGFDYDVRWGSLGRAFDRFLFRPLMGWATAWSFDRLRLWMERDLDPHRAVLDALRAALAGARPGSRPDVPSATRCLRGPGRSSKEIRR